PTNNFVPKQSRIDGVRILAGLNNKLIEARSSAEQELRVLPKLLGRVSSFCQVLFREFLQAHFAVHGHEDVRHERDQCLVGAYVRSGLLTADVLLAGGERQNESALPVAVGGLADKPSGHLPDIGFTRGDHTTVRTTKTKWHTERLGLHGDDICRAWRLDDPQ